MDEVGIVGTAASEKTVVEQREQLWGAVALIKVRKGDDGLKSCFLLGFDRALNINEVIQSSIVGEFADREPRTSDWILPTQK